MERQYDLVIIGAGPAGMTAALYAGRAGLKTLMLESGAPGGKLTKTHLISNYPGVKEIGGFDLANLMLDQSTSFGAEYAYGNVVSITKDKEVILEDGSKVSGKALFYATGCQERLLGIKGEQELLGRGISFCAVCDGAFFRDKDVVVIGGGNSALEESLFLTQFVRSVTIVIRRDVFRAEERTQKMVFDNPKIKIITKHVPVEVLGPEGKVSGVVLEHVETKERQVVEADGLFPYIGQDPLTAPLKELGITDSKGYVVVNERLETAIPGFFAGGDVVEKELRQVVTATNDGAIAAQNAYAYIQNLED